MPIRITGMNSGLDTETIIKELVKAESTKVDKLKKEQTKLQWKQDAWKELNSKMKSLFSKTVTKLSFSDNYMKKTTSVSNSGAVSVITGSGAVNATQELKIVRQAKSGHLTGAQLSKTGKYTASSKISEIAADRAGTGTAPSVDGEIQITSGGKTTAITVNADTTVSDVLTQLKKAGVNANFDEKNQRLYISAQKEGESNDFSLTASNAGGQNVLDALGINASLADDKRALEKYTEYAGYYVDGDEAATLANMQSMIDTDIANRVAAYKKSNEDSLASIQTAQEKIDALKAKDGYDSVATVDSVQGEIDALKAEMETITDETVKAEKAEKLTTLELQLTDIKQIQTYEEDINKKQAVIDANNKYITTDADGNAAATADLTQEVNDAYLERAAYAHDVIEAYNLNPAGGSADGPKRITGQDAAITLNEATYTSSNNVFEINGLTFTILSETSEPITVTTQDDTDGIYDMIKGFLKEYNALINEMDKLYNADVAKGYEPLTEDEKAELSEKDAEKWEEKIKDSILRRDSSLNSVSNMMINIMSAGVEVNGQKMFLSNFGISTLSYFESEDNEKHAYHIDGDPDDESTGSKDDKLKSAIANDPETVTSFFVGLARNLSEGWKSVSRSTEYSSYNSAYNDKLMKTQYEEYTSKIKKQEEKLTAMEDKWYSKFTAMEAALAKMQANESAVSSLLGGL